MVVFEWILYGLFEIAIWAFEELRYVRRSPLAIITVPTASLVLVTLITPILAVGLLLKSGDSVRRAARGY